jgi:hypothetical protein
MRALRRASLSGMTVRNGGGGDGSLGVSLKHASVVPPARILVIEDNSADVFLLDRALKAPMRMRQSQT